MSEREPAPAGAAHRREFLKTSTAAVVGGALAASLGSARMAHAEGSATLKVALIGAGGRGSGAAVDACHADKGAKLTVLADLFPDRIDSAKKSLSTALKDQYAVTDDKCFSGFDAYQKVMATDVDVVLLCTTPQFRPLHLKAAVEAGKHIFCEKPVAVDGAGCQTVLAAVEEARKKKLNLVSGLCWRYDLGVRDTMKKIQDGAIGDVLTVQSNYLTGTLWHRGRKPEWSEMEYQLRNWLYFTWLSGDHIVEQHIHSLDKALWLMGDKLPKSCVGLGGRQVRTSKDYGNAYDHFACCFEWENGGKCFSYTRQMAGCSGDVDDYVMGTKGSAVLLKNTVNGVGGKWKYEGPKPSMYLVEHQELFASIRAGKTINNGDYMTKSTLMAILGREACYTGKTLTPDEVLNSPEVLGPKEMKMGDVPTPPVAMPGVS